MLKWQGKRVAGGRRKDLGNIYFRSSWEANWARYLEWLRQKGEILSWEYESRTFEFEGIKRGTRFYTPDFRVVTPDGQEEYHEVKGYMDRKSATKLKRMAKYWPRVKIVLIDSKVYQSHAKDLRYLIPGWEQEGEIA